MSTKNLKKGLNKANAKTIKSCCPGACPHGFSLSRIAGLLFSEKLCYKTGMKNEIEAQFLDINKDNVRAKLSEIGAKMVKPETLMRRVVFYTGEHSFARVRDEGDKIVMTYKNVSNGRSIMGTKEVNIEVNSYDDAILFLKGCGLEIKAKQETKREVWQFGKVEICIDTWPWIPAFMEIEGPTEKSVWETAKKLGFDKKQAKYGSVDTTILTRQNGQTRNKKCPSVGHFVYRLVLAIPTIVPAAIPHRFINASNAIMARPGATLWMASSKIATDPKNKKVIIIAFRRLLQVANSAR